MIGGRFLGGLILFILLSIVLKEWFWIVILIFIVFFIIRWILNWYWDNEEQKHR